MVWYFVGITGWVMFLGFVLGWAWAELRKLDIESEYVPDLFDKGFDCGWSAGLEWCTCKLAGTAAAVLLKKAIADLEAEEGKAGDEVND